MTARLTDVSQYTGTHKSRFDDSGKGLGMGGRDPMAISLSSLVARDKPSASVNSPSKATQAKRGHDSITTKSSETLG